MTCLPCARTHRGRCVVCDTYFTTRAHKSPPGRISFPDDTCSCQQCVTAAQPQNGKPAMVCVHGYSGYCSACAALSGYQTAKQLTGALGQPHPLAGAVSTPDEEPLLLADQIKIKAVEASARERLRISKLRRQEDEEWGASAHKLAIDAAIAEIQREADKGNLSADIIVPNRGAREFVEKELRIQGFQVANHKDTQRLRVEWVGA